MSSVFATGKYAKGLCDRCGASFKLNSLTDQPRKGRPTGLLVCSSCLDEDHPQLWLGSFPVDDPQALQNPRSDSQDRENSRTLSTIYVYILGVQGTGSVGTPRAS